MSYRRRGLNLWLRTVEKRRLRTGAPATLRRALEVQARLFFYPPRGTQTRWDMFGGIDCLEITTKRSRTDHVLFYIHGGGFVFGSPDTHSAMVAQLAHRIGARAILPRYGLGPEAPFPAAPSDVMLAWRGLMAQGVPASDVVIGGDSAGGALAFGLLATLLADGADLPGAVFGLSPLTDLTCSGECFHTNAPHDVVLPAERAAELMDLFLQGASPDHPSVSPLFANLEGAPPAWITVGDTEILRDDARRLAEMLRRDGTDVTFIERHDLPHVWPFFHNVLPEARETLDALALWIRQRQGWQDES